MKYQDQYAAAKKAGAVKSITPVFKQNWKKGEIMIGKYMGRTPIKSKLNQEIYFHYLFDTDQGPTKCILGSSVDHGEGQYMAEDMLFAIRYDGIVDLAGSQKMHSFDITAVLSNELPIESATGL